MIRLNTAALAACVLLTASIASAGDVAVKGVHLCCGGCASAVQEALEDVDGVSGIAADIDGKLVTFAAKDARSAQAGINALAKAGFCGKATHAGKPIAFPPSGARRGEKADVVTFSGVHLCCTACITAAQKSLAELDGLSQIDLDRKERTIRLSGSEIDVTAAVAALNKGGFYGKVVR